MAASEKYLRHPVFSRRDMLQAGTVGLLGLSLAELSVLRAAGGKKEAPRRSVIYLFLSGGLSQHDSFDPKPDAPENIRGEFAPIHTRTPGVMICEHLPRLAACSDRWALVRSLSHPSNDHSLGHHIMLTGRSEAPPGFSPERPQGSDFPSITAVAGHLLNGRSALPASAVLPFPYVHTTGRTIPGQFAGMMGSRNDPWLLQASQSCTRYGACPNCFDHQRRPGSHAPGPILQTPNLRLPENISLGRLESRRSLLDLVERQQRRLDQAAAASSLDRQRASAWSLLTSGRVRAAFDLATESERMLDAYGRNLFGYSCLLARRLVEIGVGMVQVNLGRNETWDTHGNAFPHLKDNLLPAMDQCVSALLDDLAARGLLESTLIVMAGEFGRTPRISTLPQFYALPGRDHWGAVQTVFLAGGGIGGGTVIGESDRLGAFPRVAKQTPENLAATIYQALGIDRHAVWYDVTHRPFNVYHADPIPGLV
jgi:uncharacterized protein (DUF1501 family)